MRELVIGAYSLRNGKFNQEAMLDSWLSVWKNKIIPTALKMYEYMTDGLNNLKNILKYRIK